MHGNRTAEPAVGIKGHGGIGIRWIALPKMMAAAFGSNGRVTALVRP